MGLGERIRQFRAQHVYNHVRAFVADGDEVVCWVRARRMPDGKHGFIYVTRERLIFCWTHGKDEHVVLSWEHVREWGVRFGACGGPVLAVRFGEALVTGQLSATTHAKAAAASTFLAEVAARAPHSGQVTGDGMDGFTQPTSCAVPRKRPSLVEHGKRVVVTVIGVFLILLGLLFASPFVPGPGILTILLALGLLANEYDWAKDAHHWVRTKAMELVHRVRRRFSKQKVNR